MSWREVIKFGERATQLTIDWYCTLALALSRLVGLKQNSNAAVADAPAPKYWAANAMSPFVSSDIRLVTAWIGRHRVVTLRNMCIKTFLTRLSRSLASASIGMLTTGMRRRGVGTRG